jgi:NAD(P)-dependent dehydrogenase (short-subunit alcohol dehydrogenase family)
VADEASRAAGLPEDIARVFRLDGQHAVVTGTASGLGKAIALGFAHFGADVACLDIDLDGARETASAIAQMRRESTVIGVDVRDWESVRSSA